MKKQPPRATLTLDLTEQMHEVMTVTAKLAAEEAIIQYREAHPNADDRPEFFTLKETAELLKISMATLKRMRDAGDITTTHIGPLVRVSSLEIRRLHGGNQ